MSQLSYTENIIIYLCIFVVFYLGLCFIFIEYLQITFERTFLLAFIAFAFSCLITSILEKIVNIQRTRYLTTELFGMKFSVIIFFIAVIALKLTIFKF